MAHQAIYRKWRPMVFDDIVGQGHITQTLKNQIINDKIGHAYLFCGTRGTGKTTCAKVFSRAVNCINPQDGNPCNECEICKGIIDESILDVKEIDAASNNSVDNIREIREDVRYVSTNAKYTVYIIDEVHMLSSGAFNALLKTLEEPPKHVIFILATTEAHKVPQTILSRCQRFDFKRIQPSDIILRMKEIAHGDSLNITDDAFKLLASLADGSMRDGLSILERVVSACGNEITAENITSTLGISASESIFKIISAIADGNVNNIIEVIDTLMSDGKDLKVFIDSLIKTFRDMLICKISDSPDDVLDYTAEDMVKLKSLADKMSFEKLSHSAAALSDTQADTRWVKAPRIIYELALIKLARPEFDSSPAALTDRLASLENKVANGAVTDTSSLNDRIAKLEEKVKNGVTVVSDTKEMPQEQKEPQKKTPARLYSPIPLSELTADNPIVKTAKNWDNISRTMSNSAGYLRPCLLNRQITIDADGIIMLFKDAEKGAHDIAVMYKDKLNQVFKRSSGTDLIIKLAYENEIQEEPVDFWNLPQGNADEAETPSVSEDPLDKLVQNFSEIIEDADESEFVDYDSAEDSFSQSSFEDEDEQEEFLEKNELSEDDE
ncbi:DNA polymerase III subunit gamma/tau [Lachnospiraceae bacterium MD329]|nr:DNA polymerase III subunit gamma/tau [Lachnospiraceae bacterium MD329]